MKTGIHPKVNTLTTVTCSCGATFVTTSVLDTIHVEVCSACHPFYTGVEKFVDTEGRVDKFKRRQEEALKRQKERVAKMKKKQDAQKAQEAGPVSLKEMLKQAQSGK